MAIADRVTLMPEAEPPSERVILVDPGDTDIGTAGKLDAHERGLMHRAFSVLIWDSAGRMLLQKRHVAKYHSGGLWTNACCGHPRPGEPTALAALRRLGEEMGLACPLVPLARHTYRAALDKGLTEHEIVHVFGGCHDGPVLANVCEAEAFRWCSLGDIEREIAADPQAFTIWFRQYVGLDWVRSGPAQCRAGAAP